MKRILKTNIYFTLGLIFIFILFPSLVSSSSIVGSAHDLTRTGTMGFWAGDTFYTVYKEVCVYCHTPHGANANISAPLWNRNTPPGTGSYNMYNSTTMDSGVPGMPSGLSLACLSCHDGTIALDQIINIPASGIKKNSSKHYALAKSGQTTTATGTCLECHISVDYPGDWDGGMPRSFEGAALTTDLSNDHPISISYNQLSAQYGTEFNAPPDTQKGWSDIKLFNGKIECSSCHNVHDPYIRPFLKKSNAGSALCYTCHIK